MLPTATSAPDRSLTGVSFLRHSPDPTGGPQAEAATGSPRPRLPTVRIRCVRYNSLARRRSAPCNGLSKIHWPPAARARPLLGLGRTSARHQELLTRPEASRETGPLSSRTRGADETGCPFSMNLVRGPTG